MYISIMQALQKLIFLQTFVRIKFIQCEMFISFFFKPKICFLGAELLYEGVEIHSLTYNFKL